MLTLRAVRHPTQWWRENGPDINKHLLNPVMLRLAGRRFWHAARLEHVGRRSGRLYATPIVARSVSGGYAIPLPYGRDVDWLRNLEVARRAVLTVGGKRHAVTEPQVVPFDDIADELPWAAREVYRRLAGGDWVRLTTADVAAANAAQTAVENVEADAAE